MLPYFYTSRHGLKLAAIELSSETDFIYVCDVTRASGGECCQHRSIYGRFRPSGFGRELANR